MSQMHNKKEQISLYDYSLKLFILFICVNLITRIGIDIFFKANLLVSKSEHFKSYYLGLLSDIAAFLYFYIPFFIGYFVFGFFRTNRIYVRVSGMFFIFLILFSATTEFAFWNEFKSRFNFIAVDYLIYTQEVIKNILESYPVVKILSSILILSYLVSHFGFKKNFFKFYKTKVVALTIVLSILISHFTFKTELLEPLFSSERSMELGKNGIYSIFHAYFHNEIPFDKFYSMIDPAEAAKNTKLLKAKWTTQLIEKIPNKKANSPNIIFVLMESMSARFMKEFGGKDNITENLDRLSNEGISFTKMYSSGTRTVRGIEATMLSLPPTPGQSFVRRPKNHGLTHLGTEFIKHGYTTNFIYGGNSNFDDMGRFFSNNEFSIYDRKNIKKEFTPLSDNAWGVSDDDLFEYVIRKSDRDYADKKLFFHYILTTSNHRPYTYPQTIDIPSHCCREGAVKYADHAIGTFLEKAKNKPWFDNTIFIFVADHNASVAGNVEMLIEDYHIPTIFYAPKLLAPKKIPSLSSQVDIAPTLYSILDFQIPEDFYGVNLLKFNPNRTFIATYQTIGLLENNHLFELEPNQIKKDYAIQGTKQVLLKTPSASLEQNTISIYESAYFLIKEKSK